MQDLRNQPLFKAFTDCRLDRSQLLLVIDRYKGISDAEYSSVKKLAIDALAHNETCAKLATELGNDRVFSENVVISDALMAYKSRVNDENQALTGIITGNTISIGPRLVDSYSKMILEKARFNKVDDLANDSISIGSPGWVVALAIVIGLLALRGHLRHSHDRIQVGLFRYSFNIFGSLFDGLKGEYRKLKAKVRDDKKEGDDV
jgi:hypothetical protein